MGHLDFSELEITPLGNDAALILGRWHLTRDAGPVGGIFTLVARRFPEGRRDYSRPHQHGCGGGDVHILAAADFFTERNLAPDKSVGATALAIIAHLTFAMLN